MTRIDPPARTCQRKWQRSSTSRGLALVLLGGLLTSVVSGTGSAAHAAPPGNARIDANVADTAAAGGSAKFYVSVVLEAGAPVHQVVLTLHSPDAQVVSAARAGFASTPPVTCTHTAHDARCTVDTLDDEVDLVITTTRPDPGPETLSATLTASDDGNPGDNTATLSTTAVTPPAATMTAQSAPDPEADAVHVTGTLAVGGTPTDYEDVLLQVKPRGAPDSDYVGVSETSSGFDGPGTVDFVVDGTSTGAVARVFEQGLVTFRLVHPATVTAGAASATVDVTPRPVRVTLTAPASATYRPSLSVRLRGAIALVDDPGIRPGGDYVVQTRPTGGTTWRSVYSTYVDGTTYDVSSGLLTRHTDYRIVYSSHGPGSASAVSPVSSVRLRAAARLSASPTITTPGGRTSLTATLGPAVSKAIVRLQRSTGSGWRTVATTRTDRTGHATWGYGLPSAGTVDYRVLVPSSAAYDGTSSPAQAVSAKRHVGGNPRDHSFLSGSRWNPCQTIDYRVNLRRAPTGALADVKETLRRISQVTGLTFAYRGTSREVPQSSGRQHSELLIAWALPRETDIPLGGDQSFALLGQGGGTVEATSPTNGRIVSGYAVLWSGAKLRAGFGAGKTEGALLMHELGHAIGLDHTQSRSQIMYPELLALKAAMYGAGDYRGLQLLGRSQGCIAPLKRFGPVLVHHTHAS